MEINGLCRITAREIQRFVPQEIKWIVHKDDDVSKPFIAKSQDDALERKRLAKKQYPELDFSIWCYNNRDYLIYGH